MIILKITMHVPVDAPLVTYMDTSRFPHYLLHPLVQDSNVPAVLQLLCGASLFLVENKDLFIFAYSPPTECLIL